MGKKDKIKKNNISSVEDITGLVFEGARVALPVFIDEYSKECARKNVIENKINTLLTIDIAILTVFIPIIPFENIRTYLSSDNRGITIATVIGCMILFVGIAMMAVSFGVLMRAVNIKTYSKVDVEKLDLENNLRSDANSVEKGLCDHYKAIILDNSILNDDKAVKYKICIPITIISFLFLAIGTILLKVL